MAIWSLTCFFVSSTTNPWLKSLYPFQKQLQSDFERLDWSVFKRGRKCVKIFIKIHLTQILMKVFDAFTIFLIRWKREKKENRVWWRLLSNKLFIKIVLLIKPFFSVWWVFNVFELFASKYQHRILMKDFDAFAPALRSRGGLIYPELTLVWLNDPFSGFENLL